MKSDFLTQKLAFDLSQLLPGRAVNLVSSPHMPGESPRKHTAIIKDISPFSVTLIMVHLGDYEKDNLTGKVEEKTYPVEAFEGIGCYKLERLFAKDEINDQQE
ncbi:hypothetical protein CVD28_02320 [Bacillus sp. M6-12]|uniref:hypothetical protein n=1 Tax=Bacillus sp. M6-12 TaxID=2054166 RepID=UPI000C7668BD|nr:hypothetical protein [Bacillus sp. M6-12]PLS19268.1 hypothetical protein CVD28_02320 [Bacillus sp. M6-12]